MLQKYKGGVVPDYLKYVWESKGITIETKPEEPIRKFLLCLGKHIPYRTGANSTLRITIHPIQSEAISYKWEFVELESGAKTSLVGKPGGGVFKPSEKYQIIRLPYVFLNSRHRLDLVLSDEKGGIGEKGTIFSYKPLERDPITLQLVLIAIAGFTGWLIGKYG